ncbi:MAG: UDP-N-acetylmuramoyl-L-alanine--D-glutamate ligase [Candidatus Eiseniibacteriota bacterium]
MTQSTESRLPGLRPLVVGAARSGLAAARLLRRQGLEVRLCDRSAGAPEVMAELARLGIDARFGADDPSLLEGRDFVVWSPGIPLGHPVAAAARDAGMPVLSELEIGSRFARAPLLCVTGTNGKSTTTDLAGALLRGAGLQAEVCGNIGRALCEVVETVGPDGALVVEVSSFQLETVERLKPRVAAWLNLTPDHLDRHGSLAAYGALKQRLFARQDEHDHAVWNADDPEVMSRRTGRAQALEFSARHEVQAGAFAAQGELRLAWAGAREALMPIPELRLRGAHNLSNALAALATVLPLEPPREALRRVLGEYRGLEHRLESVAVIDGVEFVNDSKATNLDSMAVALSSFREPVVLIAGGRDKGQDFRTAAELAKRHVRQAILIGEGAERIAAAWSGVPLARAQSLGEAVERAFQIARSGDAGTGTVLLSPGCASFDMFRDYEDRGARFKDEVRRLRLKEARA